MEMQADESILYVNHFIIGFLKRFKFKAMPYKYPSDSIEDSILTCIEGCKLFEDNTGYILMFGTDGMVYISGNNPSLATSWDGSRPNVSNIVIGDPIQSPKIHKAMMDAVDVGGAFVRYTWIDPMGLIMKKVPRVAYIQAFDPYLDLVVSYDPETDNGKTLGDTSITVVMCDFIQQLMGNFLMYNTHVQNRYPRFFAALDDGHITVIDEDVVILGRATPDEITRATHIADTVGGGYLDKDTFCTQIPYYSYIIWYRL
jgi:hypothetical protein